MRYGQFSFCHKNRGGMMDGLPTSSWRSRVLLGLNVIFSFYWIYPAVQVWTNRDSELVSALAIAVAPYLFGIFLCWFLGSILMLWEIRRAKFLLLGGLVVATGVQFFFELFPAILMRLEQAKTLGGPIWSTNFALALMIHISWLILFFASFYFFLMKPPRQKQPEHS
jgi:hypothetical protein